MKTICSGIYSLRKIDEDHKLLTLDKKSFVWTLSNPGYLARSKTVDTKSEVVSKGRFWMFDVLSRPDLTKGLHLSIVKAPGEWEAFIIPDGLPDKNHPRSNIIPTEERIVPGPNQHLRASAYSMLDIRATG